ncbi:MAG TPA: hypothetical protein RMH99_31720 [Sandaracinaceae bacterium LLY-WYZ-13_1]|nr:hypothetical protein [Sandaracinaceae bacterium LLY-WYZ-13_1]
MASRDDRGEAEPGRGDATGRRARSSALVAALVVFAVGAPSAGGQRRDRRAPEAYAHLIGRVGGRTPWVFTNLRYESNNRSMRGAFDPSPEAGCDNARRQRALFARTRGVFVLRDALYSQQDHPIEHRACALMMPANWVTAAVADTRAGRALRPVVAPAMDDDAAWASIDTPEAMFGSFQPSENLFETARRSRGDASADDRGRIRNARHNVRRLAVEARALIDAAVEGPRAVAEAGAARIAASDRAYFTPEVRHDRVVVLGVEHPSEHEIRGENKGVAIWGREVPAEVLAMVRDAVYGARLRDGDIALERYDLTEPADRRRAVEVLTALVPEGETRGHRIWLWVGGGLVEGTERVHDASTELPGFLRELAAAPIARDRVVVVNRPSFRLRGHENELAARAARFRDLGLPLSVLASPAALARAFER